MWLRAIMFLVSPRSLAVSPSSQTTDDSKARISSNREGVWIKLRAAIALRPMRG